MDKTKDKQWAMRMTEEEFYLLGQLAIQESVRLKEQVSRADWIRRKITASARRKGIE